jgi:hypothetical protein
MAIRATRSFAFPVRSHCSRERRPLSRLSRCVHVIGAGTLLVVASAELSGCGDCVGSCPQPNPQANVGPSCPIGAPGQGGDEEVGTSGNCSTGSSALSCNYCGAYEPAQACADDGYYPCFCACSVGDVTCGQTCLSKASSSCRDAIERLLMCFATRCNKECANGSEWLGELPKSGPP